MYEVLIGDINGNNKILYYPGDSECVVYETNLNLEIGSAGTFEFTVPSSNPCYSMINQGAIITINRDDKEFWRGEVIETSKDFLGNISVYSVEDLTWLGLEPLIPERIIGETYYQRFQSAIDKYNINQIGSERKFEIGYVTNVNTSDLCEWTIEYEYSVLDGIRENIALNDGYLKVRRQNGKRYIDVVKLSDYGRQATQPIRFAENLLDYVEEMDMGNLTNFIIPYGEEIEEELYPGVSKRIEGNVLLNEESIERYGRHARSVIFETNSIEALNSMAQAYITRYSQPQLSFELDAIDLADISAADHFDVGDSIRVIAEPFGIDQWIYLTKQTIDLQDVANNKFSLSSYVTRGRTLTEQTTMAADAMQDIPSKASFLDAAKKNALELLNGEYGGYVTLITNENNQIVELQISNNADKEQATKKWVWNLGGLGFEYKDEDPNSATFGEWVVADAMTMDGSIVADRITSGILRAIDINGVTITGSTINGSTIVSNSKGGGSTQIIGGSIIINNTDDAFLQIQSASNSDHFVTLGADRWTVARRELGYYVSFDPAKLADLATK